MWRWSIWIYICFVYIWSIVSFRWWWYIIIIVICWIWLIIIICIILFFENNCFDESYYVDNMFFLFVDLYMIFLLFICIWLSFVMDINENATCWLVWEANDVLICARLDRLDYFKRKYLSILSITIWSGEKADASKSNLNGIDRSIPLKERTLNWNTKLKLYSR